MEPNSVTSTPIVAKTKKTLAFIEWVFATFFALFTISSATLIPKHLVSGVIITLIFLALTVFIFLIALSATKGKLVLTGNILQSSTNKEPLYLDRLSSVYLGRHVRAPAHIVLKDAQGTTYSIPVAGYQQGSFLVLLKALRPYVVAPGVRATEEAINRIDSLAARD